MEWSDFPLSYMMLAHGQVAPREDGVKSRCGGPAMCAQCKLEKLYLDLLENYRQESRKRFDLENRPR